MTQIRPAAVAGTFYPRQASTLTTDLAHYLASAPAAAGRCPKAIIVPHAGYIYSGPIAAHAYRRLAGARGQIRRVVLLGPVHRVPVRGLALSTATAFETPLGRIAIDTAAQAELSTLPQVVISDAAHALEHSLEVQLPFLQTVLGEFQLVPLAVGDATPAEVAQVLERVWGGPETLIVISSDLSHFLPYKVAQQVDRQTTDMILHLQVGINHEQACGGTPVNGLLLAAQQHHLRAELLDLRNSGDTAGDPERVVGYAAFAFTEDEHATH